MTRTHTTPPASGAASIPRADGFRLPAPFGAHQRTLMAWPCREDLFGPLTDDDRAVWAEVARGIALGRLVGREPVGLPSELSAFGDGGLGCIMQQVPAGPFAFETS